MGTLLRRQVLPLLGPRIALECGRISYYNLWSDSHQGLWIQQPNHLTAQHAIRFPAVPRYSCRLFRRLQIQDQVCRSRLICHPRHRRPCPALRRELCCCAQASSCSCRLLPPRLPLWRQPHHRVMDRRQHWWTDQESVAHECLQRRFCCW